MPSGSNNTKPIMIKPNTVACRPAAPPIAAGRKSFPTEIICGNTIRKTAPKNTPCIDPSPPIKIIISNSMDCNTVNCSGERKRILCAYSPPARPVSAALRANDRVLYFAKWMPMLWAEISESRMATKARPVGDRSKLSTTKVAAIMIAIVR